jgi:hypothetical protein
MVMPTSVHEHSVRTNSIYSNWEAVEVRTCTRRCKYYVTPHIFTFEELFTNIHANLFAFEFTGQETEPS